MILAQRLGHRRNPQEMALHLKKTYMGKTHKGALV
jgi:hypothetical protein